MLQRFFYFPLWFRFSLINNHSLQTFLQLSTFHNLEWHLLGSWTLKCSQTIGTFIIKFKSIYGHANKKSSLMRNQSTHIYHAWSLHLVLVLQDFVDGMAPQVKGNIVHELLTKVPFYTYHVNKANTCFHSPTITLMGAHTRKIFVKFQNNKKCLMYIWWTKFPYEWKLP